MKPADKSILVVDDNPDVRLSLRLALELAGYTVREAANGREALGMQHANPSGIVLTDLFMPDIDGFETIHALREAYPDLAIIAMSGDAQRVRREYLTTAELIGVQTIRKPVDIDVLVAMLDSLGA